MIRSLLALLLGASMTLALAAPACAQAGATEQRLALVIGNAAYGMQALKNPANDARAMTASLRKLGFTVIERIDAGKKAMEDAILEFGEKLKAGGVGLFYYAGHGVQVRGHNYLVPLDASLPSEASVRVQAVDVDLVLEQMSEARNRANVVILDACRNNPFLPQRRGAGKGLAAIDAARGTLIAYSTAPGTVAVDGEGPNSPYTESLVRAIDQPGLTVEEVFKRVRQTVIQATQGVQTPWESSSLTGDLVLNLNVTINLPPASTASPPAPAPAPAPVNTQPAQVAFWESMGRSTNPADYEEYLRQFPDGIYAGLARRRIADLKRQQAAAAAPPASAAQPAPAAPSKVAVAPVAPPAPAAPAAPAGAAAQQQAAIAPPPPDSGLARFDGRWTGADKQWRVVLDIRNGQVTGTVSCPGWPGRPSVNTTVDSAGRIAFDLKGLRLEPRHVSGTLPNLAITPGGDCGGASMILQREGGAPVQAATAPAPPASQPASPYAQPAAAPAPGAAELRQRSYERVMTVLLGQTVGSGIDQGKRNDYRAAPRPKAIAACIDWSGGSPDSLRVGSWASSWIPPGAIGTPPRQDALEKCTRGNNTPERCLCQVVDENDANALELPPEFATRALRR
jgi:hypothetical protein